MALIAVHAVVNVSTHVSMIPVGVRLGVAIGALENAVVGRIGMAGGANSICVSVSHRKPGVIERRAQPSRGGMAGRAGGGKASRHVVRTVGRLIVRLVTAETIRRYGRVVVVHVTTRAWNRGMRAGQREARIVVIERGWAPRRRVVAHVTLLRESDRNMVWIVRVLKVRQVTADASSIADVVVPIDMALAALHARVRTSQRPAGRRVIKVRGIPVGSGMTNFALLRKS